MGRSMMENGQMESQKDMDAKPGQMGEDTKVSGFKESQLERE